jgi:hypothetical protein
MARQRKIVQIAACGVDNVQSTQCNSFLYALCDDNSVWYIPNNDAKWFPVPPVPDAPDTMEQNGHIAQQANTAICPACGRDMECPNGCQSKHRSGVVLM